MKRHKISKDQLLKTMSTVPDAIMEIAIKQSEGWAYIKEVQY
jgi:intracellular sulfur oxidation DsrE/DsrF family protein